MQAEDAAHQDALIIRRVKPGITKVSPILYPASRAPECILHTLPVPFLAASFVLILRPRPLTSRTQRPPPPLRGMAARPVNIFPSPFSFSFSFSLFLFFLLFFFFLFLPPPLFFPPPRYISGSISHATKDVLVCTHGTR